MTKSKLFNHRPFVYLALSVLLSLFISSLYVYYKLEVALIFLLVVSAIFLIFIIVFLRRKHLNSLVITILMLTLFLIVGGRLISIRYNYSKIDLCGENYFTGQIQSVEDYNMPYENVGCIIIASGSVKSHKVKVYLKITKTCDVYVGNKISFTGDFTKNTLIKNGIVNLNPLISKVYYTANSIKNLTISSQIYGVFNKIKYKILIGFKNAFLKNYGVAYAMITGDTSYINDSMLSSYRYMGISHVFAVSGLHIGFLSSLIFFILKLLRVDGLKKFIIIFFTLLLYVAFCGFSPSCMRAFIIISVVAFCNILKLKPDRFSALCLAFIVVMILNPFDFYSIGFRLSFAVYSAIVFLRKPLKDFLSRFLFDNVAEFVSLSLIASLISFPILLDGFSYVSAFSILFNIIFVPILGFNYILTFIVAISTLFVSFYEVLAILPNIIFTFVNGCTNIIETRLFILRSFVFGVSVVPYYLIAVVNCGFFALSIKTKRLISYISIIVFILSIIVVNIYA